MIAPLVQKIKHRSLLHSFARNRILVFYSALFRFFHNYTFFVEILLEKVFRPFRSLPKISKKIAHVSFAFSLEIIFIGNM